MRCRAAASRTGRYSPAVRATIDGRGPLPLLAETLAAPPPHSKGGAGLGPVSPRGRERPFARGRAAPLCLSRAVKAPLALAPRWNSAALRADFARGANGATPAIGSTMRPALSRVVVTIFSAILPFAMAQARGESVQADEVGGVVLGAERAYLIEGGGHVEVGGFGVAQPAPFVGAAGDDGLVELLPAGKPTSARLVLVAEAKAESQREYRIEAIGIDVVLVFRFLGGQV